MRLRWPNRILIRSESEAVLWLHNYLLPHREAESISFSRGHSTLSHLFPAGRVTIVKKASLRLFPISLTLSALPWENHRRWQPRCGSRQAPKTAAISKILQSYEQHQCCGSVPLTNGSRFGSGSGFPDGNKKLFIFVSFFAYTFEVYKDKLS